MLCTAEIVQKVWEKGIVEPNNDPDYWRLDQCGAWMARFEYGRRRSAFGWEIDYIRPQGQKDGQELPNLRPMQWNNNLRKQDGAAICVVKALKTENRDISPVVMQ